MARTIHINTLSRNDAKKQAPSGYVLRKKVGGFIAYESRLDIPSKAKNPKKREYPYYLSEEDKKKPYKDSEIVNILKGYNISIARRTVAKYREMMGIIPSSKRKKYF